MSYKNQQKSFFYTAEAVDGYGGEEDGMDLDEEWNTDQVAMYVAATTDKQARHVTCFLPLVC